MHSVTDCPCLLATCLAHLCLLSLMFLIMSVIPLFPDLVCTSLPFRVTPTMILSIFLWVVISFSSWVLLSDQVSQPYVVNGSTHSLNAFDFSLIGTFFPYRMLPIPVRFSLLFISCTCSWSLVTFRLRYTYLSIFSIFFPLIITSFLLIRLLHITFSLPLMHLKAYWLADIMDIFEYFL